jgi:hypothetical protein
MTKQSAVFILPEDVSRELLDQACAWSTHADVCRPWKVEESTEFLRGRRRPRPEAALPLFRLSMRFDRDRLANWKVDKGNVLIVVPRTW